MDPRASRSCWNKDLGALTSTDLLLVVLEDRSPEWVRGTKIKVPAGLGSFLEAPERIHSCFPGSRSSHRSPWPLPHSAPTSAPASVVPEGTPGCPAGARGRQHGGRGLGGPSREADLVPEQHVLARGWEGHGLSAPGLVPTEAGEGWDYGCVAAVAGAAEEARARGPGPGGCGQELGWAVGQMDQRLLWWDRPQGPEPWPGLLWLWELSRSPGRGRRPGVVST